MQPAAVLEFVPIDVESQRPHGPEAPPEEVAPDRADNQNKYCCLVNVAIKVYHYVVPVLVGLALALVAIKLQPFAFVAGLVVGFKWDISVIRDLHRIKELWKQSSYFARVVAVPVAFALLPFMIYAVPFAIGAGLVAKAVREVKKSQHVIIFG